MAKELLGYIRDTIEDFQNKEVKIVDGYFFNQKRTLDTIELYYNSKFESGDTDSEGFHKFFYNIVHFPCNVATKAIDLDTKDFRLIPDNTQAQIPTLFLSKELRDWMSESGFGKVLNEIVVDLPKYGSVVVKKVNDTIAVVNLHNLINDPTVRSLQDGFVIERVIMTPQEMRDMKGWASDKVEKIIDLYQNDPENTNPVVYLCWGYTPEDYVDGAKEKAPYTYSVVAGIEKCEHTKDGVVENGEILFQQMVKPEKFPYKEVHWEQVRGRWLGVGIVERNFDPQIKINEIENIEAKIQYLTGKVLFQSTDDTLAKNILTDLTNGDILKVKSELTEIPIRNLNSASFQNSKDNWRRNVQESSFSFEAESGQTLPSGTPFRLGALLQQGSSGFFNFKRENVGLFLKDLFFDIIIPSFKNRNRKAHSLMIPKDDKDIAQLRDQYVEFLLYTKVQELISQGAIIDELDVARERERIRNRLLSRSFLEIAIPESFYDNAQFNMKLVITDEQINLGQQLETISNIIQLVGANPAILQDERLRALVFQAMTMAGVSPIELGLDKPAQMPQLPQMTGTPQATQNTNVIS